MSLVLWPGIDMAPIAVQVMHAQSIKDKGEVRQLTGIVGAANPRSAEMMPKGNPMEPVCHR